MHTFSVGKGIGVIVGFLVLVMWEVFKGLNSVSGIQVVGETIIRCSDEMIENVKGRLVVLMVGRIRIRAKKGECRRNTWLSACSKPVDTPNNALITFLVPFEIRLLGIRWEKQVNGHARLVGCHGGDWMKLINSKAMSHVVGEGYLREEY